MPKNQSRKNVKGMIYPSSNPLLVWMRQLRAREVKGFARVIQRPDCREENGGWWLALWAPTHSLGTLPKLNPYITTWSRFHYPSFTDKNTEVQAGPVQRWKLCNGNFLRLTLQGVLDLVQASTLHLSTLICRVKPQALVRLSHSRFTPVVPVSLVIAPLSLSEVPQLGESCLVTLLSTKWKY